MLNYMRLFIYWSAHTLNKDPSSKISLNVDSFLIPSEGTVIWTIDVFMLLAISYVYQMIASLNLICMLRQLTTSLRQRSGNLIDA